MKLNEEKIPVSVTFDSREAISTIINDLREDNNEWANDQ